MKTVKFCHLRFDEPFYYARQTWIRVPVRFWFWNCLAPETPVFCRRCNEAMGLNAQMKDRAVLTHICRTVAVEPCRPRLTEMMKGDD